MGRVLPYISHIHCRYRYRYLKSFLFHLQVFLGNFDNGTTSKRLLFSVMAARHLRFVAHSFHGRVCMRVELYGARQFQGNSFCLRIC